MVTQLDLISIGPFQLTILILNLILILVFLLSHAFEAIPGEEEK